MNDQIDDQLQIYFKKVLGRGSFSNVFLGKYKNKFVAVKIIFINNLDPPIKRQLERELDVIRLLQKNPHPNIATYYKIYNDGHRIIILMELCRGGELKRVIERRIDPDTILHYFKQIISGYRHLLKMNIVHRDIKSTNILLSKDMKTIKFIDFGLSKIISEDLSRTVCGSPLYMAPELLNQQDYDSKSDIWSLGILLYEMVYGRTPFQHCNDMRSLQYTVSRNRIHYSPTTGLNPTHIIPSTLLDYMKQLLEPNPQQRIDWSTIDSSDWFKTGNTNNYSNESNVVSKSIEQVSETSLNNFKESAESDQNKAVSKKISENNDSEQLFVFDQDQIKNDEIPITNRRTRNSFDSVSNSADSMIDITSHPEDNVGINKLINSQSRKSEPIAIVCKRPPNMLKETKESFGNIYSASISNICDLSLTDGYFNSPEKTIDDTPLRSNILIEDFVDFDKLSNSTLNNTLNDQHAGGLDKINRFDEDNERHNSFYETSQSFGHYLYSRSAPVASTIINGIGDFGKRTVRTIEKIISPK